jgi:hypothetical protein
MKYLDSLIPLVLDGTKTQTRRVLKPQPVGVVGSGRDHAMEEWKQDGYPWFGFWDSGYDQRGPSLKPRYRPGEVVPIENEAGDVVGWHLITDVRCEQVQDISRHSAYCEGIQTCYATAEQALPTADPCPIVMFSELWDSIAKPGFRWADNPWTWAYTFELTGAPDGD